MDAYSWLCSNFIYICTKITIMKNCALQLTKLSPVTNGLKSGFKILIISGGTCSTFKHWQFHIAVRRFAPLTLFRSCKAATHSKCGFYTSNLLGDGHCSVYLGYNRFYPFILLVFLCFVAVIGGSSPRGDHILYWSPAEGENGMENAGNAVVIPHH